MVRALQHLSRAPRRRGCRRVGGALLAVALGFVGVSAGTAQTQLPFTISVRGSPSTISYPAQASYVLSYTIRTTDQPATVFISQDAGSWRAAGVLGWPLEYGHATLEGDGTLKPTPRGVIEFPIDACLRGVSSTGARVEVDLPASATATLLQPVRIAAAPWPGMRATPRILVSASSGSMGTPLAAPHIRLTGNSGVRIRLHAILPKRHVVVIHGTTDPVVARGLIRVIAHNYGIGPGPDLTLPTTRTDRYGRFRTRRWHFPASGAFQFFARYSHPRRGLLADSGCLPQVFQFGAGRVVFVAADARGSRR